MITEAAAGAIDGRVSAASQERVMDVRLHKEHSHIRSLGGAAASTLSLSKLSCLLFWAVVTLVSMYPSSDTHYCVLVNAYTYGWRGVEREEEW